MGLSTGDVSIHRDAPVRVMTTCRCLSENGVEIQWSTRERWKYGQLGVVVLNEFHYMGQQGRGGAWEEFFITTPCSTQIVG